MRYILFVFFLLSACKEIPQNSKIKKPFSVEQISDGVIYEVNIRQYSKEGTFDGFSKDIPKLKALGVKVLWLMPIHPISKEKRKGELGSYYSVSDYKGINPEFGDDESFDRLVQTAHDNDMLLIIDWVANHTGWDHPWIKTNPDFYTKNNMGEITDPINPETGKSWGWTDVADLNFDNLEMQDAMISAMEYWVREQNIDGFRFDAAHGCPVDFWKKTMEKLTKIKPLFTIAESDGYHPGGFELVELFNMSYSWRGHHIMNEIAQKHRTANALLENIRTNTDDYSSNHILMNFTSNHDENSWGGTVFERLGQSVKTFAALTYFLPGMPLIYNGQEYGLNKRLAFFEKDFIAKDQTDFVSFYSQLAILKKKYSQFHVKKDVHFSILNSSNPNTVVFERSRNKKSLYFIANLSEEEQQIETPITGSFTSLMDNTELTLQGTLKLAPWEYHFLNPLDE
jgi:glycosidase